jgi:hypothetical protein
MMLRANFTGDFFGEREFVVGGFLEADGEGVELATRERSGEGGDGA